MSFSKFLVKKKESKPQNLQMGFWNFNKKKEEGSVFHENIKEDINLEDVNILKIDKMIIEKFNNHEPLNKLYDELNFYLKTIEDNEIVDIIFIKNHINILKDTIIDIENNFSLILYKIQSHKILEEYKKVIDNPPKKDFLRDNTREINIYNKLKHRLELRYLSIARKYIDIKKIIQNTYDVECEICGNILEYNECNECGNINITINDSPSFKDIERININKKYEYSRRNHFIDAINRYQGKQNKKIPDKVYEIIRMEIKNNKIELCNLTKDNVYNFLSDHNLSSHYENINLIYSVITGKKLKDISKYEDKLLKLFEYQNKINIDDERVNGLNVNFILYKLLLIVGVDCKREDFYFLKTKEKQDEHEDKWEEMVVILKEKYPDIMWF